MIKFTKKTKTPYEVKSDVSLRKPGYLMGKMTILNADGSIAHEDEHFISNFISDEGEANILNDWLKGTATSTKYLCLLSGTPGETSLITTISDATTVGLYGYARVIINTTDWGSTALDSGDMQTSASEKTFGPATSVAWSNITYVGIITTASGSSGEFLRAIALSGTTTVLVGQSLKYTLSMKAS